MARRRITSQIIDFDNVPPEALVPENEQPYEIPTHWRWVRFNLLVSEGGDSTRKLPRKSYLSLGAYPVIDQGQEFVGGYSNDETLVQDHADAVVVFGDHTRCVKFVDFPFIQGADGIKILVSSPVLDPRYLYFWLESQPVDSLGYRRHFPLLKKMAFPLPPIDEQKAIVEKLQSTNQKIDDVLETLDQFLDQAPQHRAAIIQAGVSGMLTEDWRIENGLSLDDWLDGVVGDFVSIDSQLVDPAGYPDFPHIAPDRIEKTSGRLLEYHSVREDGVSSGKQHFFPGQVLYSKIRPYLSKAVHVNFEGLCSADMYPLSTIGSARFLWYFVLSPVFVEAASNAGSRTVLPKINQKELRALPAMIPDAVEQHEIARVLDVATERLQASVDAVDQAKTLLMQMKNAVRTRALRGLV